MKKILLVFLTTVLLISFVQAQKKLEVAVSKIGDQKVKIEWQNPFGDSVVQINVQRSWDSIRNFRTIFVPLSPELPQNGFIDETTSGYSGMYYRLFYVFADGKYFFTKGLKNKTGYDFTNGIPEDKAADKNFLITIHDDDSVIAQLNYDGYISFRDSIVNFTKDTLFSLTDADVLIRYYNNNLVWVPSTHIFINRDGYVQISLADALQKQYGLRFYDERRKPLFSIKHIPNVQLVLDKTDFMSAGWYYFDLLENGKVKERNKVYIPKDF